MTSQYIKKLPERYERIEKIENKFLMVDLEILGSFEGIGNLVRHKIETRCLRCQHIWKSSVDKVINSGRNCPKCGRKSCGEKNRIILLKKSLENYTKYGNYKEYKKHVRAFTYQTIKMYNLFSGVEIGNSPGKFNIDHICSKFECFKNKIPPYVTAYIGNLQALEFIRNLEKASECWATLEDLTKNYQKWIVSHPEYQNLIDTLPRYEFKLTYC